MTQSAVKPVSVLLYGRSKIGKSTLMVQAFGPRAFYVALERGAIWPATQPELNSWRKPDGSIILPYDVRTDGKYPEAGTSLDFIECLSTTDAYGEVSDVIEKYFVPGLASGRYAALVLDGATDWAERIWAPLAKGVAAKVREYAHGKAYSDHLYPKFKSTIRRVSELGAWFGMVAHEQGPSSFEGRERIGGPSLVANLGPSTPGFFDLVLQVVSRTGPDGARRRIFHCDPLDNEWVTGERFGVVSPHEDADLRKVLKRVAARQRGEAVELPTPPVAATITSNAF